MSEQLSGDDYGDGEGYGYGAGAGYGEGYGSGAGAGAGNGEGYGYAYADGDGYGYSSGSGYGAGDGTEIGMVAEHTVASLAPWHYLRIGCQIHSVEWWRQNWRRVAHENNVSVSESQVEDILCELT